MSKLTKSPTAHRDWRGPRHAVALQWQPHRRNNAPRGPKDCARLSAQSRLLWTIGRPVTTRFFGKSVNTGKMRFKFPILLLLGLVSSGAGLRYARSQEAQPSRPGAPPRQATARRSPTADGAVTPYPETPSGKDLLAASIRTLESYRSISAEILHEVDLFDQRLVGSGQYWEQRQGRPLIRLVLKLQVGDKTSSLQQVCDGQFLWTNRNLHGQSKLTRLDVARAEQALRQTADAAPREDLHVLPGIGGLAKVLRGLSTAFEFTSAEPGRWGKEQRPVWRLHGQWRLRWLTKILPDQKEALEAGEPPELSKLPPHLPDRVVLLLGQDDLFPYRMEYRRLTSSGSEQSTTRALVTMQLFNVTLNTPLDPTLFSYQPGDLEYSDETARFLKQLGLEEEDVP